jgi:membrane-associated HD superfamily phosphohydrolase
MGKSNIFVAYYEAQAKLSQERQSNFSTLLCISFSLLFLSCFLAGSNYDYRLLTLLVAGIIYLQYAKLSNLLNFTFYGLLMIAFWCSILAISNAYSQFIGDLAVNCWASISFGLLLQVYNKRNQII